MRRLLVTGGTGYLGGELVRQAGAGGWDVTATYLTTEPPAPAGMVRWRRLEVTDGPAVPAVLDSAPPPARDPLLRVRLDCVQ